MLLFLPFTVTGFRFQSPVSSDLFLRTLNHHFPSTLKLSGSLACLTISRSLATLLTGQQTKQRDVIRKTGLNRVTKLVEVLEDAKLAVVSLLTISFCSQLQKYFPKSVQTCLEFPGQNVSLCSRNVRI